mmetsp:Transcript_47819/g.119609  ORF Transcript_47819/g.119609 Transcript_47819/m.119609 type:complete len:241 (+) Transcript_47819:566-1288(+)
MTQSPSRFCRTHPTHTIQLAYAFTHRKSTKNKRNDQSVNHHHPPSPTRHHTTPQLLAGSSQPQHLPMCHDVIPSPLPHALIGRPPRSPAPRSTTQTCRTPCPRAVGPPVPLPLGGLDPVQLPPQQVEKPFRGQHTPERLLHLITRHSYGIDSSSTRHGRANSSSRCCSGGRRSPGLLDLLLVRHGHRYGHGRHLLCVVLVLQRDAGWRRGRGRHRHGHGHRDGHRHGHGGRGGTHRRLVH